jgi:hypothetical protein
MRIVRSMCSNLDWFMIPEAKGSIILSTERYTQLKRLYKGEVSLLCVVKKDFLKPFVCVSWDMLSETEEAKKIFNSEVVRLLHEYKAI